VFLFFPTLFNPFEVWAPLRRQNVSDATGHFSLTGSNSSWYSTTIWRLLQQTNKQTNKQINKQARTHASNPLVAGASSLIQLPVHVSGELPVLYSCQYMSFRVHSRQSRWLNVTTGLTFLPLRHAGSSVTVRLEYEMERNEMLGNRSCVALSNNKFLNLLLKWMDT
jgi:hypothetical protein